MEDDGVCVPDEAMDTADEPDSGTDTDADTDTGIDAETPNAAPSGVALAITPDSPTADDDLSCDIVTEATDPNGDPLTYSYRWTVDGDATAIATPAVSAAETSSSQTWTCSVQASDGELAGVETSTSVSIAGAPNPLGNAIAEYRFDEGAGQVLVDHSGNGYDGTLGSSSSEDASDPDWESGYLSFWGDPFSGSGPRPGSCVQLPAPYGGTAALTYHLVVRGPAQSDQIRVFQANWASGQYIQLSPWGNNIRFEHSNSSDYDSGVVLDNAWHILTYTRSESGAFSFYIDNVLDTTGTHTVSPGTTTQWYLGGASCGNDPFNGDMAYMAVYDVELTADEINTDNEFLREQMAARGISLP